MNITEEHLFMERMMQLNGVIQHIEIEFNIHCDNYNGHRLFYNC